MIEAKDLMIGNFVVLTEEAKEDFQNIIGEKINDYFDVTFFNSDGVDFDGFDFTFDELKPIPLTKEWLIKFGFERKGFRFNKRNLSIIIETDNEFYLEFRYSSDLKISYSIRVFYVHYLQNLYKTFTGKELTIKETI